MPCGHVVSSESMTEYLRDLIQKKKYIITCPGLDKNGKTCNAEWDYALCKKIGVLTKEEFQLIEEGLA